jgi:DNA-binding LytR/AlgR family response regulator
MPHQLPALSACVAAVQLLIVYATAITSPAVDDLQASGPAPALPASGDEGIPATFPAALLSRLPLGIGSDIIALETEDHYLRVHALGGSALILMRMADAVALLDPQLGAQVHRRWWVAEVAVAGLRRDGQKLSLCLIDNRLVPVGRTFAATARERFGHARKNDPPTPASAADTRPFLRSA